MSVTSEPAQDGDRPWPAPGPDPGWWHGLAMEPVAMPMVAGPEEPPRSRRASGPRHRERRALPSAASDATAVFTADLVRPDPMRPDPMRAEPMRAEPTGAETARPEPMRGEPMRGEPMRAEPMRPDPMRADPMGADPMRGEPMRPDPMRGEPMRGEPMRAEPVRAQPMRAAATPAEPARAEPVPVSAAPTSPAAPPIWEPTVVEDGPGDRREWPVRTLRAMAPGRQPRAAFRPGRKVPRRRRNTRRPWIGLAALVLLALLAAFFAWFSAEPLWLSLGHGTPGTATVVSCPVHGIAKRCADFTADGDAFVAGKVTLLGGDGVRMGHTVPARMVSATASAAYVGQTTSRWAPSLLAVLLCGLGIAWLGGAFRLAERRSRWTAFGLSLTAPLLLTLGMLAAAW